MKHKQLNTENDSVLVCYEPVIQYQQLKLKQMDEFVLLMRLDIINKDAQPTPEQLKGYMKQYHDWVGNIAAQNKFSGGTGLSTEGKVLKSNNIVTDGP